MRVAGLLLFAFPAAIAAQAPSWAAALDSAVAAELARTRTPGAQVAVVVDGQLAYTKGYGVADVETGRAVTERTLFRVGSVTKMVTGTLMALLASEGRADLGAPISRYVPELAGKRIGTVTAHQLLTHSAGWIDATEQYGRMGEGALGEVMREVTDTLVMTDAGRVFSYSNPGYSMLGYVAERAGGARYAAQVEQRVLRPLGMPRATFRPLEAMTQDFSLGHAGPASGAATVSRPYSENTAAWAAGFLITSAAEFANLAIALMDGGMLEGRRVLPAEAVARVTTGHQPVPGDSVTRYGYGLRITRSGAERVWAHGGSIVGFDAAVTMFPDRKLAVIVVDNREGGALQGIADLVAQRAAGIAPAVRSANLTAAPAPRAPTDAERARLVGTFRNGRVEMTLFEDAGELRLRRGAAGPGVTVEMLGTDRLAFTPPTGGRTVLFVVRGEGGRAEYLQLGTRVMARVPTG